MFLAKHVKGALIKGPGVLWIILEEAELGTCLLLGVLIMLRFIMHSVVDDLTFWA